jgi:hypothetical protein
MIEQIIGIILLAIPISIIIYLIIDGLDKFRKSYFKEIKDEEIEELKKRMNVNAKVYETDFITLNGCSLHKTVLVSSDFVKARKGYVRGVVAHEFGHIKKKHLFKSIPFAIFVLSILYINIQIYLKAIGIIAFLLIYPRIAQRFQKEADRIGFEYVGKDVIKPLEYIYENRKRRSRIDKIRCSFINFFIYFELNPERDLEDRISCLNLLLNKVDEKVKGGNEK